MKRWWRGQSREFNVLNRSCVSKTQVKCVTCYVHLNLKLFWNKNVFFTSFKLFYLQKDNFIMNILYILNRHNEIIFTQEVHLHYVDNCIETPDHQQGLCILMPLHSKYIDVNMELVPLCSYNSFHSSGKAFNTASLMYLI